MRSPANTPSTEGANLAPRKYCAEAHYRSVWVASKQRNCGQQGRAVTRHPHSLTGKKSGDPAPRPKSGELPRGKQHPRNSRTAGPKSFPRKGSKEPESTTGANGRAKRTGQVTELVALRLQLLCGPQGPEEPRAAREGLVEDLELQPQQNRSWSPCGGNPRLPGRG